MATSSIRSLNSADKSYPQHREYVLRVLARRCRWLDPSEREGLLHDAYVVLLQKHRTGVLDLDSMGQAQIRAYLTRTALHKALDEHKSARRRLSVSLDGSGAAVEVASREPGVDVQVLARSDFERLRVLVSRLPQRRQRVLTLRYFGECSPEEIQKRLGVTARVYRRELERGVRAIKAELSPDPGRVCESGGQGGDRADGGSGL